jgi:DUF4097 and DUF4098 domain-containing protein YvlB
LIQAKGTEESTMTKRFFTIGFLIFCWIAASYGGSAYKVFRKTVPLGSGKSVDVRNRNGKVAVRSWDRDSVRIEAEIEVKAGREKDAIKALEDVNIVVAAEGGRLRIETDSPRDFGGGDFWDWIFGDRLQFRVDFRIDVPGNTALDLGTVNGLVDIRGVKGNLHAATTNGSVEIDGAQGDVSAQTTNGRISARSAALRPEGSIDLRTVNGGVRLSLPAAFAADIDASTVNGSVTTDFPMQLEGKISGKRIRGEINGGGGSIRLKTVNGSVHLIKE